MGVASTRIGRAQFAVANLYNARARAVEPFVTESPAALAQWLAGTDASGERAAAPQPRHVGFVRNQRADAATLEHVRAWTRARFALTDDVTIMVAEVACSLPGCPPRETVIAF